jgi:signal transduction histidine kinase
VQGDEAAPMVRGNRGRLRQVMEHLLNNAAQAVGAAQEMGVDSPLNEEDGGQHSIRVTVSHDARALLIFVSDTGPGFKEPAKVFDPFYVSRRPGEGAGLGLSICYGIVREHGGEINAFNLHPHGAAVVVELPVAEDFAKNFGGVEREVA